MIDKHKDYNQPAELVDEVEALFCRYAAQVPLLIVIFASFKIEIRKSEIYFCHFCTFKCAVSVLVKV